MNDYEIREALCHYIDETHCDKFRIIDELVIGNARADIVIATDHLKGYEIKGDTDSYTRLPGQIKEYDIYFQQNYLVVGTHHRESAKEHIPPYWGIMCISNSESSTQVETICEADPNPRFVLKKQLSLLWRKELSNILKANGLSKCSGKRKAYIIKYLLECVPRNLIERQICEELFERDWTLL
ncbi:MAG: sce7726 family protein [Treponema sp.]|jgi:predicted DNA-binding protein|nr:sce7726 family protein [Treponema sp.]